MNDYYDYNTNMALDLLGARTGTEAAKVYALLAIASAIRATTHEAEATVDAHWPASELAPPTGFPHFNQAR